MRRIQAVLLVGVALSARPAMAADALKFGPPPPWVVVQVIPTAKSTEAPVAMLLNDQQVALVRGNITSYSEEALKIQNAQGLAVGNLSIVWQPATETVTINKLQIRRGDKIIDVLASGQTFTVLRRETNLDAATLDGTLTASMQPEGLQEGDIIDLAATTEHSDPVLKGHVETLFGAWDGLPINAAHAALRWPGDIRLTVRQTPTLPAPKRSSARGTNLLELSGQDVEPLVPPNGAPQRFKIGRFAEATDFASWADVANLFMPLFRDASVIPSTGALHDEVEKIRASTTDPKARAEQALTLVQDRVRYVALLMGQGGYVPAAAETTWSRRFGDCKAKSALLLGILHALGIEAEPVLVQSSLGDMIADRLPMISLFDHVLVRAHIGGKDFWLDGTRTGDTNLDSIQVPDFGWGLPLIEHAQLVRMIPQPLDKPNLERRVSIDATNGAYAPATVTVEELYHGDSAVALNALYSQLTGEQRDQQMHDEAKSFFDSFVVSSSSTQFDKSKRELDLTIKGTAKLGWKDGWDYVPTSTIAFDPDFDRTSGPLHDVPWAVNYPKFVKDKATIRLPHDFAAQQKLSAPVHETLAGVEYDRSETVDGDVITVDSSERSIAPEIPYKEALAAATSLRALYKDDVYLSMPGNYRATAKDLPALAEQTPSSADEYINRGNTYLDAGRYDEAVADFSKTLESDPKNAWALADRGIAYAWQRRFSLAEADLDAAAKLDPRNQAAFHGRAILAEQQGVISEAAAWFSKALEANPGDQFSLTQRAILYQQMRKTDLALADIAKLDELFPNQAPTLATSAYVKAAAGRLDEAEKDLNAALKINPALTNTAMIRAAIADGRHDYPAAIKVYSEILSKEDQAGIATPLTRGFALHKRAAAHFALNQLDEAIADTDAAIKGGYKPADLRLLRANIFMRKADQQAAVKEADLVTKENPNSNYAFVVAGRVYSRFGLKDRAIKAFDRALAIKPEAYVYINRAQVRPLSDETGRSADLDEALKLDPQNADALGEKAQLLMKTGDYAAALKTLDSAKSVPDDTSIERLRATVLYKAGRTAEAERSLQALRQSAKSASDFNELCWAEATAGIMLESAVQNCDDALKLKPDAGAYEDSLGMALLKLGKLDEALAAYNKAVAKNTGAASLMGRAFVYARKGDRLHAEADAAAARKLYADIDDTFADYGLNLDQPSAKTAGAAH